MSRENNTRVLRSLFNSMYDAIGVLSIETEDFNNELNRLLDLLKEEDFFGTEGQCDPRKDWRNN